MSSLLSVGFRLLAFKPKFFIGLISVLFLNTGLYAGEANKCIKLIRLLRDASNIFTPSLTIPPTTPKVMGASFYAFRDIKVELLTDLGEAEKILGFKLTDDLFVGKGGSKIVFDHPERPGYVVKVLGFGQNKIGSDYYATDQMQIDLSIHHYLSSQKKGIIELEDTPELWKYGITIQRKSHGKAIDPLNISPVEIDKLNRFLKDLKKESAQIFDYIFFYYRVERTCYLPRANPFYRFGSKIYFEDTIELADDAKVISFYKTRVGIDIGSKYSNIHFIDGEPILIDW